MFRRYLAIALAIGVTAGFIGLGSALFTDNQSVGANTFTTGTIDISTSPTTALVTFANMAPGDSVVGGIMVNNIGTLDMRYTITSTATNTDTKSLMSQIVLKVYSGVAVVSCNDKTFAGGTLLYTGPIGNLAGLNIVGDPTPGQQAGDRLLAAGISEALPLCFSAVLPSTTGNTFQGAITTATFTFNAEQTANN